MSKRAEIFSILAVAISIAVLFLVFDTWRNLSAASDNQITQITSLEQEISNQASQLATLEQKVDTVSEKVDTVSEDITSLLPKASTEETHPQPNEDLLARLRDGGHVLYMRHAQRERVPNLGLYDVGSVVEDIGDPALRAQGFCLTPLGRHDAEMVGRSLEALGVSVGSVYASPTCRTIETARAAFGTPTPAPFLLYLNFADGSDAVKAAVTTKFREALSAAKDGENIALVGHGNFLAHLGLEAQSLKEADIFVINLLDDEPNVVARMSPKALSQLVYQSSDQTVLETIEALRIQ